MKKVIKKLARIDWFIFLFLIGIILCIVLFLLNSSYIDANYDEYYKEINNNIECEKIETQAVCSEVVEEININYK